MAASAPDPRGARRAPTTTPASALQREVWGLSDLEITSAIQLIATVHAGGLLLVAEAPGDGVVGFSYAFAGCERRRAAPALRHARGAPRAGAARALGLRLKWAQRDGGARAAACASSPGPSTRCARRTRGSTCAASGRSRASSCRTSTAARSSALHHGLATDRLLARWELDEPARQAPRGAHGRPAVPKTKDARARINEVRLQGRPAAELGPAPRARRRRGCCSRFPSDWD